MQVYHKSHFLKMIHPVTSIYNYIVTITRTQMINYISCLNYLDTTYRPVCINSSVREIGDQKI